MSSIHLLRRLTLRPAAGLLLGGSSIVAYRSRTTVFKMDGQAMMSQSTPVMVEPRDSRRRRPRELTPRAETISQISSGCVAGLLAGIAVSMISKVIIFVAGAIVSTTVLAYRLGLNPLSFLRVPERYKPQNVVPKITHKLPFKASFSVTFLLAAFARI